MKTTESKNVKCIGPAKQKFFGGPGGDIPRFTKKPPGHAASGLIQQHWQLGINYNYN
jgi:hypothetical protein